jgi:hypothetical protein
MRSEVVVVVARLVSSRLGAQAVAGKRRNGSGRLEEEGREANRGSCECECEYESNESGRTATTVVEKADVFYMARFRGEDEQGRWDGKTVISMGSLALALALGTGTTDRGARGGGPACCWLDWTRTSAARRLI